MSDTALTERGGAATSVERHAHVLWTDRGGGGCGRLGGGSRTFSALPISLADGEAAPNDSHTTPGELLAAALAASFAVTLADLLARRSAPAHELVVDATCQVQEAGSVRALNGLRLRLAGRGNALTAATFAESADAALACCPVSRALSATVPISVEAHLAGST